jgi:hypothetical protein
MHFRQRRMTRKRDRCGREETRRRHYPGNVQWLSTFPVVRKFVTPRPSDIFCRVLICIAISPGLAQQARSPEIAGHSSLHSIPAFRNIEVIPQTQHLAIEISLSTPFAPHVLRLTGPDRLVFDFPGYELQTSKRRIAVNGGPVQGLRLSQFQAHPAITRVVVDLKQPLNFEINSKADQLVIEIAFPRSTSLPAPAGDLQPDAKDDPATTGKENRWEESKDAPADPELAEHSYELAADQGVPKAQFRLGQLLARKSESQDSRVLAYKWLTLAQSSIKESSPLLSDLKKLMSPQEVEEAEHKADDWRRTHHEFRDQLTK